MSRALDAHCLQDFFEAEDGVRTRDPQLGKKNQTESQHLPAPVRPLFSMVTCE
jgi:hypothetical protein